jgi:hypothetical protein
MQRTLPPGSYNEAALARIATIEENEPVTVTYDLSLPARALEKIFGQTDDQWMAVNRIVGIPLGMWDTEAQRKLWFSNRVFGLNASYCFNTGMILGGQAPCMDVFQAIKNVVRLLEKIKNAPSVEVKSRRIHKLVLSRGIDPLILRLMAALSEGEDAYALVTISVRGELLSIPISLQ